MMALAGVELKTLVSEPDALTTTFETLFVCNYVSEIPMTFGSIFISLKKSTILHFCFWKIRDLKCIC